MPGNKSWKEINNWASALYTGRVIVDNLPDDDKVYYGKIQMPDGNGSLGEMVHESEIEL